MSGSRTKLKSIQGHESEPGPSLPGPEHFLARAAGDLHGSLIRTMSKLVVPGNPAQTTQNNLARLAKLGVIAREEAGKLSAIVDLAHGNGAATDVAAKVEQIYQEILDQQGSSDAAILIAGIAANSTATAPTQPLALNISFGDIAGAIAGTLVGYYLGLGGLQNALALGLAGGVLGSL